MKKRSSLPENFAPKVLLRLPQVLEVLGIGRSCFYKGIQTGLYPRPVKVGPRVSAWPTDVVEAILAKLSSSKK